MTASAAARTLLRSAETLTKAERDIERALNQATTAKHLWRRVAEAIIRASRAVAEAVKTNGFGAASPWRELRGFLELLAASGGLDTDGSLKHGPAITYWTMFVSPALRKIRPTDKGLPELDFPAFKTDEHGKPILKSNGKYARETDGLPEHEQLEELRLKVSGWAALVRVAADQIREYVETVSEESLVGRPSAKDRNDTWLVEWRELGEPSFKSFANSKGVDRSTMSKAIKDAIQRENIPRV